MILADLNFGSGKQGAIKDLTNPVFRMQARLGLYPQGI
jgi:hypothetical protein